MLNLRSLARRLRRPAVAVPAVAALVAAIVVRRVWFFKHQARVRWAREAALPEIERIVARTTSGGISFRPTGSRREPRGHPARPQAGRALLEMLPEDQHQDGATRREGVREGYAAPDERMDLSGRFADRASPAARRRLQVEVREGGLRDRSWPRLRRWDRGVLREAHAPRARRIW